MYDSIQHRKAKICVPSKNLASLVFDGSSLALLWRLQGSQTESQPALLSQVSVSSSGVQRHSSEESETIVCSLLASIGC